MNNIFSLFKKYNKPFNTPPEEKHDGVVLHFHNCASSVRMTSKEKKETWEAISANTFLQDTDTSVRKPILSRLYYRGLLSTSSQQSIFFPKRKYTLGIIASTLIVTGSISVFAQGSLPGNLLYNVKTGINEKIQITLAITPQAKADVEATLAMNRLEETESLALEGKLNTALKNQIDKAFDSHVHKFETHLTELESKSKFDDIAKVGVSFQTKIAVHAAILKDMEVNSSIISSGVATKVPGSKNKDPNKVTRPEDKLLLSAIPVIVVTKKALAEISSVATSSGVTNFTNENSQHKTSMDIDLEKAKEYLLKLHEDIGTPSPVMKATLTPVVSIVVPQKIP